MDRFDVCEAFYCYAADYHGGSASKEYAIFSTLSRLRFRPSPRLTAETLSEGAREIYNGLASGERRLRDRRPQRFRANPALRA